MNKTKKQLKVAKVVWQDACSHDEWTHTSEIKEEITLITTIGILYKESKDSLIIALNFDESNDNYSCFIVIPKSMINNIRIIKI